MKRARTVDEAHLSAFRHEIWALTQIRHPHLVQHVDDFVSDGLLSLVMRFVDGDELSTGQTDAEVLTWLPGVLSALDHLHQHGVIHGDIRPENLRRRSDGQVILMDLGLLSPIGQVTPLRGTPAYMAPEIILGHPLDGRTDLYSLGVVLFQILAGKPPFEGPVSPRS